MGWGNTVRSRLYLSRIKDAEGREWNADDRKLTTTKANYGPAGGDIDLQYRAGQFAAVGDAFNDLSDAESREDRAERVFLKLLDRFTAENRNVSASYSSTYAPKVFSEQPDAERCSKDDLRAAMDRLFARGVIHNRSHQSKG